MRDGEIGMKIEYCRPQDIEKRSFEIIDGELSRRGIVIPEKERPVTMRVIHTTADFSYTETLKYSEGAVDRALSLLRSGCDIVTDTNMAKAGISKKRLSALGGSVHCFMADPSVAAEASQRSITRAAVSMERAAHLGKDCIFAIGNAPTALIALHDLMLTGDFRPAFVIGVPVGFVNVEAAKELFLQDDKSMKTDYIINRGRKGGSTVAAAICNALIYEAAGREQL